jgi:hypothetical protein
MTGSRFASYSAEDLSWFGYIAGLVLIFLVVVLPLLFMGLRAKNIFRRGGATAGALDTSSAATWYS